MPHRRAFVHRNLTKMGLDASNRARKLHEIRMKAVIYCRNSTSFGEIGIGMSKLHGIVDLKAAKFRRFGAGSAPTIASIREWVICILRSMATYA